MTTITLQKSTSAPNHFARAPVPPSESKVDLEAQAREAKSNLLAQKILFAFNTGIAIRDLQEEQRGKHGREYWRIGLQIKELEDKLCSLTPPRDRKSSPLAQEAKDQLFNEQIENVKNLSMTLRDLQIQQGRLIAASRLVRKQIKELHLAYAHEWEAVFENTNAVAQAISAKINCLIRELEFFKKLEKDKHDHFQAIWGGGKEPDVGSFVDFYKKYYPAFTCRDLQKREGEYQGAEKCLSYLAGWTNRTDNLVIDRKKLLKECRLKFSQISTTSYTVAEMFHLNPVGDFAEDCKVMRAAMQVFKQKNAEIKAYNEKLQDAKDQLCADHLSTMRDFRWDIYSTCFLKSYRKGLKCQEEIAIDTCSVAEEAPKRKKEGEKLIFTGYAEKDKEVLYKINAILGFIDRTSSEYKKGE